MIYTPGIEGDRIGTYDELSAAGGSLGLMHGPQFIRTFFETH